MRYALHNRQADCSVHFLTRSQRKREVRRSESGKMRRLIQSRRRHFHNSKSSLGAQLSTGAQSGPGDVLIDNAAVAMIGNLGACLEEIDFKGRHFGEYSLSIVLYEKNPA